MARTVTVTRPDVVVLIEEAAAKFTGGNKTEVIAVGMRRLLADATRSGSLFGAHPGSVHVRKGTDLLAPPLM
jgi:hypothetical protein